MSEASPKIRSYVGDDAGGPGLNMLMGGITGAQQIDNNGPPPPYPGNASTSQTAYATVDPNAAYGKKVRVDSGAADDLPVMHFEESEIAIAFDVVADESFFSGKRRSVIYKPKPAGSARLYQAIYAKDGLVTIHRGTSVGPEIGHCRNSLRGSKPSFMFRSGLSTLAEDEKGLSQEFVLNGEEYYRYEFSLPAIAGKIDQVHGWQQYLPATTASRWTGARYMLTDAAGRNLAAYIVFRGGKQPEGQLLILRPDLEQPALDQIIVSSVALQALVRSDDSRAGQGVGHRDRAWVAKGCDSLLTNVGTAVATATRTL